MKRYKPVLLQVGILLLILAVFFYILEHRTKYKNVDISKLYESYKTVELTGFEVGELWQGNFSYDSGRVLEGRSSITLSSWYGKENTIQNNQSIIVPQGYTKGYLTFYVANKKSVDSLVFLKLELTSDTKETKLFDINPQVKQGWNRVSLSIPAWKKISKQVFTIQSKKGTIAEVNLDRLWAENTTVYNSDIFTTASKALSLRTIGERTYLFSSSPEVQKFVLNSPSAIRQGTFTLTLIPEHAQEAFVSLNKTSIGIGGKNLSECSLYKNEEQISNKKLKSISAKDNSYLLVQAIIKGDTVEYSLSNNGVDFESCGVVTSLGTTPISLLLKGSYLIDSYSAEY